MEKQVTKVIAALPLDIHAKLMDDKSRNRKDDGSRLTLEDVLIERLTRDIKNNPDLFSNIAKAS